ncbi:MAG TPA: HU family DNA-binding protein [bacterium]|nr:HU family DNA-binding protein [bacterium]
MTKAELIDSVAETKGLEGTTKKAVEQILDLAFDEIAKAVRKEKRFAYPGFGTWTVRTRKARMGVNPQTKKPIKIPATKTVGFKPAPVLKKGL